MKSGLKMLIMKKKKNTSHEKCVHLHTNEPFSVKRELNASSKYIDIGPNGLQLVYIVHVKGPYYIMIHGNKMSKANVKPMTK